jgi:hypothetical protein
MPEDERGSNQHQPEDPYIEALERFKRRSFATFGVVIFLIAMSIAVIVEAAGAKKVWDASFSPTVHAEPAQTPPCR